MFWIADGERCRRNFKDYRKADKFQAGLEDDIRSARYVNPQDAGRTFDEVAAFWTEGLRGSVKQSTKSRYLRELRVWVLPRWSSVPLDRIGTTVIQRWVVQLVKGTALGDAQIGQARPLAPKSIKSVARIMFKSVLDYAVSNRWLAQNPVDGVKLPKTVSMRRRVYLTPVEVKCIAEETRRVEDMAAVYLLAYTGLRIGELLVHCDAVTWIWIG